tara:strand:+ start:440 stop:565 length:126 start_codon:yes stop_codon:yes gene_type:complete
VALLLFFGVACVFNADAVEIWIRIFLNFQKPTSENKRFAAF